MPPEIVINYLTVLRVVSSLSPPPRISATPIYSVMGYLCYFHTLLKDNVGFHIIGGIIE